MVDWMRATAIAFMCIALFGKSSATAANGTCYYAPDRKIENIWAQIDSGAQRCKPGYSIIIEQDATESVNTTIAAVARLCDLSKAVTVLNLSLAGHRVVCAVAP